MKDSARLFLIFGTLLSASSVWATTPCYFPDGSPAIPHTPCTDGQQSACCYNFDDSHHDSCFSNGMCMSLYFGYLYRGSCTDSTFRDPACPNRCVTGVGTFSNGSTYVTACGDANNNLCCGTRDDATTCCDNNNGFQWDNATILADYYGTPSSAATSSTTASSSTTAPATTAAPATTTATSPSANNTTTAGGAAKGQESCSSRKSLGVGVGVGLGLPLIFVSTALALLLAQRRREHSGRQGPAAENQYPPRLGPGSSSNKELPRSEDPQRTELHAPYSQELES